MASVLRAFRLLRVVRLARFIGPMRSLLSTVIACVANVAYMTLLLFLFVFTFAVVGMQGAWSPAHTVLYTVTVVGWLKGNTINSSIFVSIGCVRV